MNECRFCGRKGRGYRREPDGYVAWFEFAEAMGRRGYAQKPCPGCGRLTLWARQETSQ